MWSVSQVVFINVLVHSTLSAGNSGPWKIFNNEKTSFMNKVVVDILRRCFESDSTDTIGFIGKSNLLFATSTTFSNSIATILIEDPETAWTGSDDISITFPQRLPAFVISSSEGQSIEQLLKGLEKSRWWNHEATFIVLDGSTSTGRNSCVDNARELLLTTWKMDILTSIFLCMNHSYESKEVFVYTYNPYKETAPKPWVKVETYTGPDDHPWTLFEQAYNSDRTTCDSIKFANKTLELNGFPTAANFMNHPPMVTIHIDWKSIGDFHGTDSPMLKAVLKKLNVSLASKMYGNWVPFGSLHENYTSEAMIADVAKGEVDINLNLLYIRRELGIRFTIPQSTGGLSIITRHRGWKTPLKKITDFIKFGFILTVIVICLVVVLVTSYSPFHFVFPDLFNVARLFVSAPTTLVPRTTPQRLLLFTSMLMVLVFNSVFQGNLAGLLTSHIMKPQIETIHDIDHLGYDIYGRNYLTDYIPLHLLHRFHDTELDHRSCFDLLKNMSNIVCIGQKSDVWRLRANQNVYISKKRFATFHKAHITRKNWPLYGRFNILTARLIEIGVASYWKYDPRPNLPKRNRRLSAQPGRVLTDTDLRFAFKMLAFGLVVSGFTFIIEFIAGNLCRRTSNKEL